MFISSYNTYIQTNTSNQPPKSKIESSKESATSFKSQLSQVIVESKNTTNLPIDYISNYKAFNNKQKLQEQLQSSDLNRYKKTNENQNAKVAYEENSKMFSLFLEPQTTQKQVSHVDKKLPIELQKLQENIVRHVMLNTYLENDKYYQITA
ncbi:MAG: hypothetical protein U9N33_02700 [Campylobacterota bacterium]|nr:hypothetical protein [Campylobacterota bacterium]